MRVFHRSPAVTTFNEIRDEIHGTGTVEGDQCGDMLDAFEVEFLAKIAHAAGFQLEHAERLRVVQHLIGFWIIERNGFQVDVDT